MNIIKNPKKNIGHMPFFARIATTAPWKRDERFQER